MDTSDPNNPNPDPGGTSQAGQPPQGSNQSDHIIADVPNLPPPTVPPSASPASPWGLPETPHFATSPWETPAAAPPVSPTEPAALPQTPLPPSQPVVTSADVPTAPAAPAAETSNPFLNPQAGVNFSVPQTSFDQMQNSSTSVTPVPNPNEGLPPDPLNTAFNPISSLPENPFAQGQMSPGPDASLPAPPPGTPGTPDFTNPDPPAGVTTGFVPTQAAENSTLTTGKPGDSTSNPPIIDQKTYPSTQPGTLDLSSLQNTAGSDTSELPQSQSPSQPGSDTNPQGNSPVENAPTDLSHLIAGDEAGSQPMGNVYTPPVAADQPPGTAMPQTPSAEGGSAAPPEKHLNLTKVLLVAGIPIILIVAALSAYLILGVGKAAPEDETSLPVEQTNQDQQAPLTNPPQQIVAPSPATIPESATSNPTPTDTNIGSSPSPAASSSPTSAMEKLKARQSASPAASSSPAASASTSLPS